MDETALKDQARTRLNTGLRDLWYPVVASWEVAEAPTGVTRLGEKIVLWRDGQGKVNAVEDRCPHRGARLSMGWNLGDRVACWYHGVEVDAAGRMAAVPAIGRCEAEKRARNRTYHVIERAGAIWLWFGNDGSEPAELTLPEEVNGGEWEAILCTAHWSCNYRYAAENVMDPMHGAYLHSVSHSMAEGDKTATMRARATDHGFVFEKTNQSGINFDWTEFGATGAYWQRLSIPYRRAAGPGGSFGIVGLVTPVDSTNCRVFFWRCRKVQGWQRDAWKFLYRARLETLHWDVLEQDRLILEGMDDDAREHEALYAHDAGLVKLRRLMEAEALKQVTPKVEA
ncbi:aromatic ring-hydroxylating oxygenase subunit alpha [Novosphingobium rosa]|uniref:aromatic ring-hydroxylating oxygenase subunit alpha n=1 Tax=Novosphingobium rosa TaxID=76978 RepID=UPI00082A7C47|nr:aromatic ring-hydroxylating dioxygenase subunit alpha [Novosphingobium rosa]